MSDSIQATAPEPPSAPEADQEMNFFEHLGELRARLLRSILALVPAVAIAWFFSSLACTDTTPRPRFFCRSYWICQE